MIIDIHTHPTLFGKGGSRAEVDRLVAYGRSLGVERMVILGDVLLHGRLPTHAQVQAINDKTIELTSWYPDYFLGFCFLNPTLGEAHVMAETRRCIGKHGFRGIKLEICNNARDDKWMRPVMLQAAHFGVPVLQHSADQTNIRERAFHTDPADTALLGRRYPEVKIIMAHLTACGMRGVLEIMDVPNVWLDTSAYLPEYGLMEYAVEKLGADRVVYGSDLVIRDLPVEIGRVTTADISEAAKAQILFRNAERLLGLTGTGDVDGR